MNTQQLRDFLKSLEEKAGYEERLFSEGTSPYTMNRGVTEANEIHGNVDFLKEVIPEVIQEVRRKSKRAIRVLDVATGIGLVPFQIRQCFPPNEVRVFSTSVSKKSAISGRAYWHTNLPDHSDDFISQSVITIEERDFDLIIDTKGEAHHLPEKFLPNYFEAVVNALSPGGRAYISLARFHQFNAQKVIPSLLKESHCTASIQPLRHTNIPPYSLPQSGIQSYPSRMVIKKVM